MESSKNDYWMLYCKMSKETSYKQAREYGNFNTFLFPVDIFATLLLWTTYLYTNGLLKSE